MLSTVSPNLILQKGAYTPQEILDFEKAVEHISYVPSGLYRLPRPVPPEPYQWDGVDRTIRKSQQKNVKLDHPFVHKLLYFVVQANIHRFKIPMINFLNQVDLLLYDQEGDHFTWHVDPLVSKDGHDPRRKISTIVFLSKQEDYDGSRLYFKNEREQPFRVDQDQGSIVHFNSLATHRVTPLTRGVRKVVVAWSG